jgi:hypothetical protein
MIIILKDLLVALIPGATAGGLCVLLGIMYLRKWYFAVWLPIVAGGSSLVIVLWLLFGWVLATEKHAPGAWQLSEFLLLAAGFVSATLSWPIILGLFVRPRWQEITKGAKTTGFIVYIMMAVMIVVGGCLVIR